MPAATITCKNCGNDFLGKYCNQCGEKVYTDHDKSLVHVVEEGVHFITHFEGTIFKTLGAIFTRPGKLSYDYCEGIRKSYFKPLSFFLLLVVIYLLFPVFEGLNMRLYYHTHSNVYGAFASEKIRQVMISKNLDDTAVSELFHQKSEKLSKFLLLLLIPMNALILWAISFRRRPYFFDQFVLSAEINSFYLLALYLIFPLVLTVIILVARLFGAHPVFTDPVIGTVGSILLVIFVSAAMRRFYRYSRLGGIWRALVYAAASLLLMEAVYKFILFFLTWLLIR